MVDLEKDLGLNIPKHENNPTSRKAAYIEAMQQHKLGTNLKGEDVNLTEKQAKYLYNQSLESSKGISDSKKWYKPNGELRNAYDSFKADVSRGRGEYTSKVGGDLGQGFGFGGHFNASRWDMTRSAFVDSTKIMGEGLSNSLGFATAQQRRQFKTGGMMGKAMTGATVGFGAYNLISTGINGGDMYDALTDNVSAGAGMAGFHMGSKLGGAMFGAGSKKSRFVTSLLGGAVGGLAASQAVSGVMSGAADLTSSDSKIAKSLKGFSQLSGANGSIEQNDKTLTMRQKALQQLSQSSMNDRGSILGSEASILRGYM